MKFQKKNKPVTKKYWDFVHYLPSYVRQKMVRSQFEMCYNLSSDYVFKHAETEEEIEEALNIVYEAYIKLGYIDQRPERIHFNKYLCLPTTAILIIKYKNEVIGTMSIISDSAVGLPTETTWDIQSLKAGGKKLAEISSLSIKKTHKSNKGHILLTLCKFMYHYCVDTLKLDGIVIATTQEVEPFYTDIFLFKRITNSAGQEHKLVKGNKSSCCYLSLDKNYKNLLQQHYGNKAKKDNFHHFLFHYDSSNIIIPEKKMTIHGVLSEKNQAMMRILEKFPHLKEAFSLDDKLALATLDPSSQLENVISIDGSKITRTFPRISIRDIQAFIFHSPTHEVFHVQIRDVSNNGFGVRSAQTIEHIKLNDKTLLIFKFEEEAICIYAKFRWKDKKGNLGFQLEERSFKDWEYFIHTIFEEIQILPTQQRKTTLRKVA